MFGTPLAAAPGLSVEPTRYSSEYKHSVIYCHLSLKASLAFAGVSRAV